MGKPFKQDTAILRIVKSNQTMIIAGVFIVVVIAAYLILSNAPGPYDSFARCLAANNVTMYGAFWCPHCKDQKAEFGSSFKYASYVECSTPDASAQTQACIDAKITTYPTWQFANGSRHEGVLSLQDLSAMSGCALNSS